MEIILRLENTQKYARMIMGMLDFTLDKEKATKFPEIELIKFLLTEIKHHKKSERNFEYEIVN